MTETFERTHSGILIPFEIFRKVINTDNFSIEFTASSAILQKRTFEEELSYAYETAKKSHSSDFINF